MGKISKQIPFSSRSDLSLYIFYLLDFQTVLTPLEYAMQTLACISLHINTLLANIQAVKKNNLTAF